MFAVGFIEKNRIFLRSNKNKPKSNYHLHENRKSVYYVKHLELFSFCEKVLHYKRSLMSASHFCRLNRFIRQDANFVCVPVLDWRNFERNCVCIFWFEMFDSDENRESLASRLIHFRAAWKLHVSIIIMSVSPMRAKKRRRRNKQWWEYTMFGECITALSH